MELSNTINSTLLNVKTFFRLRKVAIDVDKKNLCELAHRALAEKGIQSSIQLDENNQYVIKITKIDKLWGGE